DPITSGVESSSYTAVSRDINNNIVSDTYNWTKANNTGSANLSVDKLTGVLSGTVTITATSVSAPAKSGGKTVTVVPGAIAAYSVIPASYSAVTGTNQTVTVTARDANGNTVDYDSSTVITTTITAVTATPTVTFYTNSSYTVTTTTYTLSGGSATVYYRAVYDGTPPQGFTITAQDNNSNQGTSNTVTIPISGPATKLVFTAPPTSVGAGSSFIPTVQVSVQDDYNNIVPAAANTITLTVSAGAVLGVITQTNAVSGIAIFTGLTAGGISATGYTLTATSAGLTSTTSTVFAITPGVANNLAFIAPPQIITAGNTWASLTVRVRDVYTNPVSGTSVSITSTNGTLINGTLIQVSAADGLATFSGLSMTLAANNYVLSATAGALSTTSSAFNITPAAPNTLAFIQQPGTTTAGASITPSVAVEVRDQYNNLVPSVDVSITATNGTLINGALTVASDLSGIATFSPISITLAATGYALSASVPTLNAIRSTDFDIIPASANRLAFIVQPTNTTVGNGFTPSVSVTVQDAYGNTRADAVNAITITGTGGLTFGGTNPRPAAGGIATFSDLTVGGISATGYTLTASAAGLVFATSTTFNLSGYGSAGALAFVQQPTDTRSGNPFSPVVTVRILDAYNNFVSNATNPVSITASSGATLGGAYTGVSAVAGIATFTGVTISGTANPYTLTATSAGLASAVSNSFNITSSNTGTGADNAWTISTAVNINVDTNGYGGRTAPDGVNWSITNNVASGQTTISSGIARPTGFAIGDEIIIINLKGISTTYTDVGLYEFRRITGLPTGSSITVDSNLTNAYDGSTQRIMVQRVPNYTDVTINTGGSLTCNVWNFTISDTGGVIAFRVSGTLTVNVANGINASAVGFAGGAGTAYNANAGAGESYNGTAGTGGTNTTDGNTGQGGGGGAGQDFAVARTGGAGGTGTGGGGGGGIQGFSTGTMFGGAGGGGGHGTIGTGTTGVSAYYGGYNGSDANGGAGGQGWGTGGFTEQGAGGGGGGGGIVGNSSTLNQRAYLGGGGGAGGGTLNGSQTANNTSGGRGGGIIFIGANAITVAASASITATGQTSNAATGGNSYRVPGGNGGGAGGSIIIIANTLINSGSIAADGGSGSSAGGYQGGAGGQGRTYIDINGTITTTPVSGSITFTYTGAEQQWVVPTGVTLIQVDVQGARGANGINSGATAGNGARVQTTLFVTPGQTLYIYAGGQGSGATGGFNGGGNSNGAGASTGGGGGGSDIRQSGTALANRIIVAGGGGGGGYDYGSLGYTGSAGAGGQNGGAGTWGGTNANGAGGGGGTQSGGGAGGGAGGNGQIGGAGALGTGGYGGYANGGANPGAGGGGGGYYGGGGGGGQAGGTGGGGAGGGSSWTSGTGSIYTTGYQTGNGLIIISY
ncbi:MAG: hypothetical protein HZA49_05905, partial [Planctomycetes bacterium]|nr:hypothetical protein [Planctomycetota bacterium]